MSIAFVLAGGLLLLVGAGGTHHKNIDMAVSKPALHGNHLSGKFRLYRADSGIDSNQTGGACLVADIASLLPPGTPGIVTGSCSSNAECNPLGAAQTWSGYCAMEENRCWYRPIGDEKQLCKKSPYTDPPTIWSLNKKVSIPAEPGFDVHAFYREYTGNRSARWRLIGCLNGQTPGCAQGTSDFIARFGEPKLIP